MSYDDHDRCRHCGALDNGHSRDECDRRNGTPVAGAFPTPADLRARIETTDAAAVHALMENLSAYLAREWSPSSRKVVASLGREQQRVVDAVIARLAASGWRATYGDDQREGRWLSIEAL